MSDTGNARQTDRFRGREESWGPGTADPAGDFDAAVVQEAEEDSGAPEAPVAPDVDDVWGAGAADVDDVWGAGLRRRGGGRGAVERDADGAWDEWERVDADDAGGEGAGAAGGEGQAGAAAGAGEGAAGDAAGQRAAGGAEPRRRWEFVVDANMVLGLIVFGFIAWQMRGAPWRVVSCLALWCVGFVCCGES